RRHTIFSRDWSSDVCSSDLCFFINCESDHYKTRYWVARLGLSWGTTNRLYSRGYDADSYPGEPEAHGWAAGRSIRHLPTLRQMKIGRASCRARREVARGGGA